MSYTYPTVTKVEVPQTAYLTRQKYNPLKYRFRKKPSVSTAT